MVRPAGSCVASAPVRGACVHRRQEEPGDARRSLGGAEGGERGVQAKRRLRVRVTRVRRCGRGQFRALQAQQAAQGGARRGRVLAQAEAVRAVQHRPVWGEDERTAASWRSRGGNGPDACRERQTPASSQAKSQALSRPEHAPPLRALARAGSTETFAARCLLPANISQSPTRRRPHHGRPEKEQRHACRRRQEGVRPESCLAVRQQCTFARSFPHCNPTRC
jgi:hypothetical protein